MNCTECGNERTHTYDSRPVPSKKATRRRRRCCACAHLPARDAMQGRP